MSQSVEQALELIRENRPDATDRALGLLQNTVYSFSMKVCGHRQDAEDTMQDVLLKSIPHLARFDDPKALKVWLYKGGAQLLHEQPQTGQGFSRQEPVTGRTHALQL